MPYYKDIIPGMVFPYDPMATLIEGAREGDSVVVEQRVDSLLRKGIWKKLPSGYQAADKVITRIKILRVFDGSPANFRQTDSLIHADKQQEWAKMDSIERIMGPRRVEAYLQKHHIQAEKTRVGTYLQILQAGSGDLLDSGDIIHLKFTLATLEGKILNSNIDTSFHSKEPLEITVGRNLSIPGIDQTLPLLKKGAHVKIYIPTMLAYGSHHERTGSPDYHDIVLEALILDKPSTP
jgi:FKBP-type peptidyl-prolyl cis-trans isomerase